MHRPFAGWTGLALLLPALLMVGLLFVYPLGFSLAYAFRNEQTGGWDLTNFAKAFDLYGRDIALTAGVTVLSTALVGVLAIAIAGYITLGENPRAVKALRWIYRWPLFIPFVVAAQLMRTFLAKNGMLNNTLMSLDLVEPLQAISLLDWRGVVITFVWKQLPFAALLISGAMAAMDRSLMESARGLGAGRLRILIEIVLPQVQATVWVSLILSFVTMLSALSVPMMIIAGTPTLLTVDMAWRVNSYGDYGVANALGFVSFAMSGLAAWFYLRQGMREGGLPK
ncbi:MAG: ABC transporter permease subunit [Rhodoferax sp.]|jgi:putative spermidine/putrescine transport system permease protein|nr:ABC transporter permease subunit [Rhodoferax sp.]MBP9929228.1 ABC transporter permease subunit [Rhodoferax sp.]HQX58484.1 ABC transporter permease subunit [Burkholderiaceae bacterium]HQZ04984.1 ABC transporter permease subunit [Burkholderiaceae bacterium]